jgi:hypothetical protein
MRLALVLMGCAFVCAPTLVGQGLPMEPSHDSGQSVTGAFEGWYRNADGSFNLLLGYYNRNQKTAVDIPVGPENHIDPGGPDQGQPVHFLAGRQWGMFTIRLPKDFGDKKLTWTLTINGKTTQIPMSLNPLYEVEPFKDANGNTPPFIAFTESGPFFNGPVQERPFLTATAGIPLTLPAWFTDDEKVTPGAKPPKTPAVSASWSKFRGPGPVEFDKERPAITEGPLPAAPKGAMFTGKASTTATFAEPGDYILRLQANDWTGEGGRGFQCCWSSALVKVTVKPAR